MDDEATTSAAGEAVTPADKTPTQPAKDAADAKEPADEAPDAQDQASDDDPDGKTPAEMGEDGEEKEKKNRVPAAERIKQITARKRLAERERDTANRRADQEARRADALLQELQRLRRIDPEGLSYDEREQHRLETTLLQRDVRQARSGLEEAGADARVRRNEAFIAACEEAEASGRIPNLLESFSTVTVTEPMAEFVGKSDLGPEMAFYLAQKENRRELSQLVELTDPKSRPTLADLREADRIMARIEAKVERAKPVRKATRAPNPGTTLNGGSPPATATLEELAKSEDASAYIKRRQEQWAKERR